MTKKKAILIGCGAALLVLGIVAASAIAWLWYVAQDPKDVSFTVEAPTTVRAGEEFTLTVEVHNHRETRPFELTDIDISEAYLGDFLVLSTSPPAKSTMHVPLSNTRSFTFNQDVPPGETLRFEFAFRPTTAGLYSGDVDVWEGQRFLTNFAQTEVKRGR